MAQWPARTWSIGELVTAGMMNSVRDALNELHAQIRPSGGIWTDMPFVAGNFAAPGATWTVTAGQIVINRYTQIGKTVYWNFWANGTTLGGTPGNTLQMTPPVLPIAAPAYCAHLTACVNGVAASQVNAYGYIFNGPPLVARLASSPGTNFAAGNMSLAFTWEYEAATL
jgi:hypothetical protein